MSNPIDDPVADRDATAIYLQDGEAFQVGQIFAPFGETARKGGHDVTRIVISADLPGMYAFMERARVFVGDTCVFEAPVHALEGVAYALELEEEGGSA